MSFSSDRREFLKKGLVVTASVITGGRLGANVTETWAEDRPDLVIANGSDPAAITRAAVDALGGMGRFVKSGAKVVIKPNMSFSSGPGSGANTHPAVVAEVAKMCIQSGASKISILDNVLHTPSECLSLSKIPAACENLPKTSVSVVKAQRLFR